MKISGVVAVGGLFLVGASGAAFAGDTDVIVGFKGGADAKLLEKHGGKARVTLSSIGAVAGRVPASAIADLRADPDVAYVEEDGIAEIQGKAGSSGKPTTTPPPESTPWGITRVNAPLSGNVGAGIKVAVIDTGADLDHPDLAANLHTGINYVSTGSAPEDDNGHGTHVAGTIGAVDNTIGVIGVAPEAALYPVKVLDRRGSGSWSDVASGITWAADNGMQIANMSLGGGDNSTLANACTYAADAGVLLIAAAGNSGDGSTTTTETGYPAAYSTVVAVGATDSSDRLASFSNTGAYVEVCAPGVSILSTYKGDKYDTLNGTSMASPHAAGVAALLWWEAAQTTTPSATDIRTELGSRVQDLGASGRDNGFGYGIVYY